MKIIILRFSINFTNCKIQMNRKIIYLVHFNMFLVFQGQIQQNIAFLIKQDIEACYWLLQLKHMTVNNWRKGIFIIIN